MNKNVIASFAQQLDSSCKINVVEAADGMIAKAGYCYIGKGGCQMVLRENKDGQVIITTPPVPEHLYMPSVSVLFDSASDVYKENLISVIMTGMGDDGADMIPKVKDNGGVTIAESEESAIVFGMPKRAIQSGAIDHVYPSWEIPNKLMNLL